MAGPPAKDSGAPVSSSQRSGIGLSVTGRTPPTLPLPPGGAAVRAGKACSFLTTSTAERRANRVEGESADPRLTARSLVHSSQARGED
jgi:hypothetical protein